MFNCQTLPVEDQREFSYQYDAPFWEVAALVTFGISRLKGPQLLGSRHFWADKICE